MLSPNKCDVCVLYKPSNFCSRKLEMHSKRPRFQNFSRNSPLPRLQISSLPRVFSFFSAITVGRTKRLKGFQTFFKVYFLFTHGGMTASMTCICILFCALFSELSVASVDAGLTITVARNVAKTVQLYSAKCEQLVRLHVLINIGTSQV